MQQTDLFFGLGFIWLCLLSLFVFKNSGHYRRLTSGVTKKDLKSVLEKILKNIKSNEKQIKEVFKKSKELEEKGNFHFQKIGFMRYNPFKTTGGDQSFILSLLDGEDNGVVITSLHSREMTRIYAKPVKGGEGEKYKLSAEEKGVVKSAKKATHL
jgi:hypothetical protein